MYGTRSTSDIEGEGGATTSDMHDQQFSWPSTHVWHTFVLTKVKFVKRYCTSAQSQVKHARAQWFCSEIENVEQTFSSSSSVLIKNRLKTNYSLSSLQPFTWCHSLVVLGTFCAWAKVPSHQFSTVFETFRIITVIVHCHDFDQYNFSNIVIEYCHKSKTKIEEAFRHTNFLSLI